MNISSVDIKKKIMFALSLLGGNASYAYNTQREKIIHVDNTFIYTNNGYTEFMIVDTYGNHYNVNNSIWYWKWDSIEEWNRMHKNDILNIKYYGYRIPLFGFFPNIYYSKKIHR